MSQTDPVADVLTKIRNASSAKHPAVDVRASELTTRILTVLQQEGFIRNFKPVGQPPKQQLRVYLKYAADYTPAIGQILRVSKPGRRRYRGTGELPRVLNGIGRAVLTTNKGVMTERQAKEQGIGGEVLCYVW